ncbi:hypothetical protein MNB_SV-5-929 [hydrothermal vent metagenome]|uniref:Uncharacterized protein n=1 Tax=hydrothermal vent metagenome TaxID=652676 RepID=A0A1W1EG60_9ZZZZ
MKLIILSVFGLLMFTACSDEPRVKASDVVKEISASEAKKCTYIGQDEVFASLFWSAQGERNLAEESLRFDTYSKGGNAYVITEDGKNPWNGGTEIKYNAYKCKD